MAWRGGPELYLLFSFFLVTRASGSSWLQWCDFSFPPAYVLGGGESWGAAFVLGLSGPGFPSCPWVTVCSPTSYRPPSPCACPVRSSPRKQAGGSGEKSLLEQEVLKLVPNCESPTANPLIEVLISLHQAGRKRAGMALLVAEGRRETKPSHFRAGLLPPPYWKISVRFFVNYRLVNFSLFIILELELVADFNLENSILLNDKKNL